MLSLSLSVFLHSSNTLYCIYIINKIHVCIFIYFPAYYTRVPAFSTYHKMISATAKKYPANKASQFQDAFKIQWRDLFARREILVSVQKFEFQMRCTHNMLSRMQTTRSSLYLQYLAVRDVPAVRHLITSSEHSNVPLRTRFDWKRMK